MPATEETLQTLQAGSNVETLLVDAGSTDATVGIARSGGATILQALNGLSEPARTVVILREIQGLSYQEISDVTDIQINTVRVTLHRARRRLRDSLKEVQTHVANG